MQIVVKEKCVVAAESLIAKLLPITCLSRAQEFNDQNLAKSTITSVRAAIG